MGFVSLPFGDTSTDGFSEFLQFFVAREKGFNSLAFIYLSVCQSFQYQLLNFTFSTNENGIFFKNTWNGILCSTEMRHLREKENITGFTLKQILSKLLFINMG